MFNLQSVEAKCLPEEVSSIVNILGSWIKTNMIDGPSLVSLDSSVE